MSATWQWAKANPDAAARRIRELERENAALKQRILDDNKAYGCELMDPSGTIWDHAKRLQEENAALRADIHAHEQINRQLIEDKRRLDYMEQNIDFISWRFYGKPQPFDLRGTIDAKRKEAQP